MQDEKNGAQPQEKGMRGGTNDETKPFAPVVAPAASLADGGAEAGSGRWQTSLQLNKKI